MKVGLVYRKGSFSDRWIEYMEINKLEYVLLDPYDNDIISYIKKLQITHFMWHFSQNNYKDILHAKTFLTVLNKMGIKTFPNHNAYWHFDDKIAQKYLLEAVGASFVNSKVFYNKEEALRFFENTTLPIVFKLRGGAGSINVQLVRTRNKGKKLINQAFSTGFYAFDSKAILNDVYRQFRNNKSIRNFLRIIKWSLASISPPSEIKIYGRQIGYVYFQEFVPNLNYDIRLIVIGNKCFFLKRNTRNNDFRASGSGLFEFEPIGLNRIAVHEAFKIANMLKMDCVAFDFVITENNIPKIIEISYGFLPKFYDNCLGYFNYNAEWIESSVDLDKEIIKVFLKTV